MNKVKKYLAIVTVISLTLSQLVYAQEYQETKPNETIERIDNKETETVDVIEEESETVGEIVTDLSESDSIETEVSEIEDITNQNIETETIIETETEELKTDDLLVYKDFGYLITSESEITIMNYFGSDVSVTVPEKIGDYFVTNIGDNAFSGDTVIRKLVLPDTIKSLGDYIIKDTNIMNITIPKSVTECSRYTFWGAKYLTRVIFEDGMEKIPDSILDCTGSWESNVQEIVIPDTVTEIGAWAFKNCESLKEISIPDGVKVIGGRAFWETNITELILPESITRIGWGAFLACKNLKSVKMLSGSEAKQNIEIEDRAFYGCSSLEEIVLNPNITQIDYNAFAFCTNLKKLVLPVNLKNIESLVFDGTAISKISIPKNTVYNYNSQKESSIEKGPFYSVDSLKEVIFEEGTQNISDYILSNNDDSIEKIIIPSSVTSIGNNAFYGCSHASIYGIPGSFAEKYAIAKNMTFIDIRGDQKGLYRTSDYIIKAMDDETEGFISDVKITIVDDKEKEYYTNERGVLQLTNYGTVAQRVSIEKEGYETIEYSGWPWKTDGINIVRLKKSESVLEQILASGPDIELNSDKLKGPEITFLGESFNVFEVNVKVEMPIMDCVALKVDNQSKTVQMIIGYSEGEKAELEGNDTYWKESYNQVKDFVNYCSLKKTDTTKLWKKFSNIRDNLKTYNGSVGIDATGNLLGFVELSYASGKIQIIDGGMTAMLQVGTAIKVPFFWCVYGEIDFGGTASGKLKFDWTEKNRFGYSGDIGLALDTALAIGAGTEELLDIKGGMKGTLSGTISLPAQNIQQALYVTFQGDLFIKASSPIPYFCYSKKWDIMNVELYPDFGAYLETDDCKLAMDDRVIPKEGEAYEYADPQVVSLNDGRKIKVYITDDGTKSTGNHTTLMYQVYDNGTWSTAKAVCETGRADSGPVLYAYGDEAYVAWLNINKVISSDTPVEEVFENTDLYFAEFNGTTFNSPELVPDKGNQKLEFNYAETSDQNNQVVAWVENSQNDPFMQNGTNTVYYRIRNENAWSEKTKLYTTEDKILNLAILLKNGKITVYYSDGNRNYYVSGGDILPIGEGSSPKLFAGRLFYLENGTLHEKKDEETKDYRITCSSNYQIMDDIVYWTVSTGYTSELYMQKLGDLAAVQLTYDDAYVSSFTLTRDSSGKVVVEYISTEVDEFNSSSPYGKSYAKTLADAEVYDLSCDGIFYNATDIQPGKEAEFKVQISNYSSVEVNNIKMRVTGTDNSIIMNDVVIDSLEAGKSQEVSFKYTLPSSISGLMLKAEVYADGIEEAKEDNNSDTCTFDSTDLQIVTADKEKVVIKNNGYITAEDVKVSVYEGGSNGTLVDEQSIGSLASGKSVTQNIYNIDKYLDFENYEDTKVFLIRVTSSTDEALLADNDYLLQIEPPHVTGVTLDKTAMTLAKGKKTQLNANISAETDADTSVFWNSSDKDIVTVDDQGNVTAVDVGTAIITVMTLDGGYSADCEVTVTEARETPTTVELISAKAGDKGDIFISWKAVEGADGYLVYRKSGKESWKRVAELKGADDNSWTDTTGTIGTAYTYTVRAYMNSNGENILGGFDSKGVTATVLPATVVLKKAADNGKKGINVTWEKVSGATGYRIYRKTSGGSWKGLTNVTSDTTTSYTDNSVTAGTTYIYTVRAYKTVNGSDVYGGFDNTGVSAAVKAESQSLGTVVLDKTADSGKGSIIVSWKAVEGAEGYRIYKKFTGSSWQKVTDVASDKLSYDDGSGVTGKTYTYTVRAFKHVDGKEVLGGFDSKGLTATKLPAKVTLKVAKDNGKGGITVSWNKVSTATGYRVYRKEAGGSWKGLENVAFNATTTYTDQNVTAGKSYTYTVRAYKEYEGKSYQGDYDKTGKTATVTSLQGTVKLLGATAKEGRKITVTWEKAEDCDGYILYRKSGSGSWSRLTKVTDKNANSYTDGSGTAGTTYTYTVRAYKTINRKEAMGGFDSKGVSAECKN